MTIPNFFDKFPTLIIDDNYILREQSINDYQDFFEYFSDNNVSKYILSNIPVSLAEAKDEMQYWINLYQRRISVYWAIADRNSNKMIGAIGFNDWNRFNNRAEISYDLNKAYWRQGITTKALQIVLDYGFNTMQINRIQASTLLINKPSWQLLKSAGFQREGSLIQYRLHNGKYFDIEMYGLTKDLYLNNQNKRKSKISAFFNK
ncbi:MAG: GNAT family N-acetyltransferase [Rickettsiales bacterium]|jgi:[ribosomal protein S5]-alanine N-acetyltransferase|nr:GNAT family N-acetyltransferase [Rickettsiales bacterium]